MARADSHADAPPYLARLTRGWVLSVLGRRRAEKAYRMHEERLVDRILWTGREIEAALIGRPCTVRVGQPSGAKGVEVSCTICGSAKGMCEHAGAALLRWIDVRPTMLRKGPGTLWRCRSRQPFVVLAEPAAERINLSHLTGAELRSALELQLSLQRTGTAAAELVNRTVEVRITVPSGGERIVTFSAEVLPSALPVLRSLPRLELGQDLADLEISEVRLAPVLVAAWEDSGVLLEPGYRLPDSAFLPLAEVAKRRLGRWARVGHTLCRLLDPDTPLVPFFRRGRTVLEGRDALRYLTLDHPTLTQKTWYLPRGSLAEFRRPVVPRLARLEVRTGRSGRIVLKPVFRAGEVELRWDEIVPLLEAGFSRHGELVLAAPDLGPLERAGFTLNRTSPSRGLRGNRTALMRLVSESDAPVQSVDPTLSRLASVLRGESAAVPVQPKALKSRLRPYQQEGAGWLWSRHQIRVGALLADDMGLGKTHQVMALLTLVQEEDPEARALVVCPRGVMEHWQHLLATYAPRLGTYLFHGAQRSLAGLPDDIRVVLTTYDIMVRSVDELQEHTWKTAVFDEAQRIKNPRTKAARAARKIPADHRVALSGTPLENRLAELWSVVDLIAPGYLGSQRDFRATHRNPTREQLGRLRRRLAVLTLRRLKEQVLSELPAKVEDLRYCRLSEEQRDLYQSIERQRLGEIMTTLEDPDSEVPYMHIFALLTRLKQVCDHPALVAGGDARSVPSGKLSLFDEILDEALAAGENVVVYSQYVKMIELLSGHLDRRSIAHLTLTGSTRDRGRLTRRFNSGQHERVLLASLLAGGVGIDLTGASVVIHYDRWWNPAKENQATDRVHRIGQRRFVHVFKLVTLETVEERIDQLIRSKLELMDQVVAPTETVLRTLTRDELARLLGIEAET